MTLLQMLSNLQAPGWRGHLAAFIAGAPMVWAFAPYELYIIAPLALAMLFVLLPDLSPRQAFYRGWWFGMGYFGIGVSWVYVSIHVFGYAPAPLAVFFTLLFAAYLSLFTAAFSWLALWLRQHRPNLSQQAWFMGVLPALWVLLEWTRGWFLTGFPWLAVGYSQLPGPLAAVAPIGGVYTVSLVVTLIAGALVMLFNTEKVKYLSMMALMVFISLALRHMEWTPTHGNSLKVTMVQGNIAQELKWLPEQKQRTLQLYADLSEPHWQDNQLIIWPEAAITAWYHEVLGDYLQRMDSTARTHNSRLLTGIPYYDFGSHSMYNSVITLGGDDNGVYHKVHLAPFGDFLPLEDWLRGLIDFFDLPMSSFSAGSGEQALLSVNGIKAGVSICYEDVFGEEVIQQLPEAALLINVSNDSWWGKSFGPQQHMQIAAMRALETGRPLLRSTNNGVTGYVDHLGYLQAQLPQFETDSLTVEVQPRSGATPYVRGGSNLPIVSLLLMLLLFSLRPRKNS